MGNASCSIAASSSITAIAIKNLHENISLGRTTNNQYLITANAEMAVGKARCHSSPDHIGNAICRIARIKNNEIIAKAMHL
jgi:hypothetical protein